MRKFLSWGIVLGALVLLTAHFHVVQAGTQEEISTFNTTIQAHTDGSIRVIEQIQYDFGINFRHGIYRKVPMIITNDNGDHLKMTIRIVSVTDENGRAYQYTDTEEDDNLNIKIGDPNNTITGSHWYTITYDVWGAYRYFSDHDELFWNSTGTEWTVPIKEAKTEVTFGATIPQEQLKGICFTGVQGSTEQSCTIETYNNGVSFTTNGLGPSEGLTFSVAFPKGIVAVVEPVKVVSFWDAVLGRFVKVVLIATAVFGAIFWYILYPLWLPLKWYLYGRDPDVGREATASFDPPKTKSGRKMTAAETGTILDEKVDNRDIAALVVQLAQKGYLTIIEKKEKDFYLEKKKEYTSDKSLESFEKTFLEGLFKTKDSVRLKDAHLAKTVETVSDDIYTRLTNDGYFPSNPVHVRNFYATVMGFAAVTFNLQLLLTGTLFGLHMARKTILGAEAAKMAKGLKNFLQSQDRQLNFQGKKQLLFEKLLPFAVAFGVEKNWIERFKDIGLKEPDWYQGYYSDGFQAAYFASSLSSSVGQMSTAATPVSSSTGSSSGFSGGSSGGGGGGGGGGSW